MRMEAAVERLLRVAFGKFVQGGKLRITTAGGVAFAVGSEAGPEVAIRFTDRRTELAILLDPELKLGEAYMDGTLVIEQGTIADFLFMLCPRGLPPRPQWTWPQWLWRYARRRLAQFNPRSRARRNVAHHYDLDHRLYRLFLDDDFQYSCAYFERPELSLEAAQLAKKRLITAKLLLEPDSRVLDIGSGWGGLALYMKQIGGAADVSGVTLSTEQLAVASKRARERGLEDSVHFALQDYRKVEGTFDRIVSVGMFEHVGPLFYGTYFAKCRELLRPDGVMLMHTIGLLEGPWYPNPWLDKYIFPGGQLPALSEIVPAIERAGLIVTDVECLRLHYAATLAEWSRRFMANCDAALALYDERFCRMWEFYLAACEAAFRYQNVAIYQVQCARRQDAVPLTRDYIAERMHDLRMREVHDSRAEELTVTPLHRRSGAAERTSAGSAA
jgi:cyclopropane-fatty-acyl-phospholipid synthase